MKPERMIEIMRPFIARSETIGHGPDEIAKGLYVVLAEITRVPKHINLTIEHQPHATCYETVEHYLGGDHAPDCTDEDRVEMLRTGEVWTVQWYPNTPIGFCHVAAPTFWQALARANQ